MFGVSKPILAAIVAGGVLAAGAFVFLYTHSHYSVPSNSMMPTIGEGDWILARGSRASCGRQAIKAGDIVIHRNAEGVMAIRRVVAGPGARTQMRAGTLIIDGLPARTSLVGDNSPGLGGGRVLRETLRNGVSYEILDLGPDSATDETAPVTLGPGQWYGLGNSRDNAMDSRITGPINEKDICGVVTRRLTSGDPSRKLGVL